MSDVRRAWTPQEEETLLGLIQAGLTPSQMAEKMGRVRNSVASKMYEMRSGAFKWRGKAGTQFHASFQIPTKRANDDLAHCLAVIRANGGNGFPFASSTGKGSA